MADEAGPRPAAEAEIDSRGGARIHVARYAPQGDRARALLAIVPGFSDHGGRYGRLIRLATAGGCAAATLDTRGHGRSSGPRGHVGSFDEYLADLDAFLGWARREAAAGGGEPPATFVFGHSMGGLIVLSYLAAGYGPRLAGAIVQAPPFRVVAPVPRWKVGLARTLSRVAPTVPFESPLRPEDLSRDPSVGEEYMRDPLVHRVCSPRLYVEMTAVASRIFANPIDYGLPTLFTHGEDDRMVAIEGTRSYFERSPLVEKRLRTYPGARHEVHNDASLEALWADVRALMAAPLAGAARR
jgi:alpha-beta hydrolase superfamily lysophospholipase